MKTINVFTKTFNSPDWGVPPTLLRVAITDEFLEKAKQCVEFMKSVEADEVLFECALDWDCFEDAKEDSDDAMVLQSGSYVEYDGEYTADCCHARVGRYGTVMGTILIKHTDERMTFDIGSIEQLEQWISEGKSAAEV